MNTESRNLLDYIVICISEFASRYKLHMTQAYIYLRDHQAIAFLEEFYDVEHTLSFSDAVDDMRDVCIRNGGTIGI